MVARRVFLYHPAPCPQPIPRCGEPPEGVLLLASDVTPAVSPPGSLADHVQASPAPLLDRTGHRSCQACPATPSFSGLSGGDFAPRSRSSYTITCGFSILVSYVAPYVLAPEAPESLAASLFSSLTQACSAPCMLPPRRRSSGSAHRWSSAPRRRMYILACPGPSRVYWWPSVSFRPPFLSVTHCTWPGQANFAYRAVQVVPSTSPCAARSGPMHRSPR